MMEGHITEMPKGIKNNSSETKKSEFYDKVKKLHDDAVEELKQEYFDKAYAEVEEALGTYGRNECIIGYFELNDDDAVERELIDLLKADGFKADFDDDGDGVVVTL